MRTTSNTNVSDDPDDSDAQAPIFKSQDAMYERCPPEELEEFAGLAEHPDETVRRLTAAGEWEGPGGAQEQFEAELRLHMNSGDPGRKKCARWLAYAAVQQAPKWKPQADAVSVPTIFEQRERAEDASEIEQEREHEEPSGCQLPELTAKDKARFRQIDEEFATGQRRRDAVGDMHWVYQHIYDEDVTATDAPSRGAWSALYFSRTYPDRFYGSIWPPVEKELLRRSEANPRGVVSEGEQKIRDEIRQMIRGAEAHQKRLEAAEAAGR